MKIGDKIRILKDNAAGTRFKVGDILIIKDILTDEIVTVCPEEEEYSDREYYFNPWNLGDHYELVEPEQSKVDPPQDWLSTIAEIHKYLDTLGYEIKIVPKEVK